MRWWKWLGVAGMAGVAATGVAVARNERQRRAYSPDDVRARLHERAAAVDPTLTPGQPDPATTDPATGDLDAPGQRPSEPSGKGRWARFRRR
jgi:hypothetical protein